MKKLLFWIAAISAAGLALFLFFAPAIVDDLFNSALPYEPYPVSTEAQAHYDTLEGIVDLHADPLLWRRDLNARNARGQVDVPRMVEGKMAIQVFGSVTKTPKGQNYESNSADTDNITLLAVTNLWPIKTWDSLIERALFHSDKLRAFASRSDGQLVFATTSQQLEETFKRGAVAGIMALEGAHALEGEIDNLDRLHAAGFRMIGLAHFFDNEVAGSVHGVEKYGLTDFGRRVITRAEQMGMVIDIAHASHAAIAETLAVATRPVVFSHGGVKGVCDTNRNLTDPEIIAIAENGGLIGLGAWDAAACGVTPKDLARAMAYVKALVGPEHVALGTDFDGAIRSAFTIADYPAVVDALVAEGFTGDEIDMALYRNAHDLLVALLPN